MRGQETWESIGKFLGELWGEAFVIREARTVGGGCINEAFVVTDGKRKVFVKRNRPDQGSMFEAEAEGLRELGQTAAIRVPGVYGVGRTRDYSWIAMEYLDLGRAGPDSQTALGKGLARLHQQTAEQFGWRRDNTIGSTPQRNPVSDDWVSFWGRERLGYQFDLAAARGGDFAGRQELLDRLPEYFEHYQPKPALLHGDLWSGNVGFTRSGEPVVFDPAVYYGDREAEFGIIEMFGGFSRDFYAGYESIFPLDDGFQRRRHLYLLYHQLNHYNLFGASYGESVRGSLRQLLSQ